MQGEIKNIVSKACFNSELARTKANKQEYRGQLFNLEERKQMARISNENDLKEYIIKKTERCTAAQLKLLLQICTECLQPSKNMDVPKHESCINEEHPGNSLEGAKKVSSNTEIELGPQEEAKNKLSLTNPQQNGGIELSLLENVKIGSSHSQHIELQEEESLLGPQEKAKIGLPPTTILEIETPLSQDEIVEYHESTKNGLSQTESQVIVGQSELDSQEIEPGVIDPPKEARNASPAGETREIQQTAETAKLRVMAKIAQCQEESNALQEKAALCVPKISMPPRSAKEELVTGQFTLFRPTGMNQLVIGLAIP